MPSAGAERTLAATLAAVWATHRRSMLERAEAVSSGAAALVAGTLDEAGRYSTERAVHQLTGTLGMFGMARGTDVAREIEDALRADAPVRDTILLTRLADELRGIVAAGPPVVPPEAEHEPRDTEPARRQPLLQIVSSDPALCERLDVAAQRRGMRTVIAEDAAQARVAQRAGAPDAVILELVGDSVATSSALRLIADLDTQECPVPVLVLAASDTVGERVEVARHGARGFFHPDLDPERVLDAAQRELAAALAPPATRVLAVDDDPLILDVLGPLLAPLGVSLTVASDALGFWSALEDDAPDLVILDVDMPGVDGIGLCRAIRNDLRYSDLPVLFLTARTDAGLVQRLYSAGADDYVAKPIVGPELTTRLANRLERARLARRLADTDGLTGIATRRKAEDVLARFTRMAERAGQPFTLAVLDVDHFKRVNDRFGHAAGDSVLRALARHLQQAFRGEDVVARWGGEEFVIGMYGMPLQAGMARVSRLLETFAAEDLGLGVGPVTFSAGLASYPADGDDVDALYRAADTALYEAKAQGRNRVQAAEASRTLAAGVAQPDAA